MLKHRAESAADRSGGLPLKIDPAWLLSLLLAFGFREFIGGFTGHSLVLLVVFLGCFRRVPFHRRKADLSVYIHHLR